MFKKHCVVLCAVLLAMLFGMALDVGVAPAQVKTVKPLYQRLGGYDAIAAVVDDFIGRLAGDEKFGKFFAGHSQSSLKKIRQLIVDQLCEATGGPCYYTGRDMKTAHAGLGISEEDWNASVVHLVATLDKFNVPQQEKDEVIGAIAGMKDQIVEKSMSAK
jgi:hemoglobin